MKKLRHCHPMYSRPCAQCQRYDCILVDKNGRIHGWSDCILVRLLLSTYGKRVVFFLRTLRTTDGDGKHYCL